MSDIDTDFVVLIDPENRDQSESWIELELFKDKHGKNLLIDPTKSKIIDRDTNEIFEIREI